MNTGWYIVYLLMIAINSVMTTAHGFHIGTWQHWVWFGMLVICFIAGDNCYK